VCLNAIESVDANNPAGPPLLVCGHRYHAFCLNFWVEKCRSKCIEAVLPGAGAGRGERLRQGFLVEKKRETTEICV